MDRGFNRALSIDLFETGNITMRIVDGQKKSDEAQQRNRMRLGYMGQGIDDRILDRHRLPFRSCDLLQRRDERGGRSA